MGDNRYDSADSSYHLCSAAKQKAARTNAETRDRCLNAFILVKNVVGIVTP